jgi:hypothetical protein
MPWFRLNKNHFCLEVAVLSTLFPNPMAGSDDLFNVLGIRASFPISIGNYPEGNLRFHHDGQGYALHVSRHCIPRLILRANRFSGNLWKCITVGPAPTECWVLFQYNRRWTTQHWVMWPILGHEEFPFWGTFKKVSVWEDSEQTWLKTLGKLDQQFSFFSGRTPLKNPNSCR